MTRQRLARIAPILEHLGETPRILEALGSGAQSSVWRLDTDVRAYALKVYHQTGGTLAPGDDLRLRQNLLRNGAGVAVPVLSSDDLDCPGLAGPWMLDVLIRGRALTPEGITPAQAATIGGTLRLLHKEAPAAYPSLAVLPRLPLAVAGGSGPFPREETPVVCHADIHPAQIIAPKRGGVQLLDFGAARACDARWDLAHVMIHVDANTYAALAEAYDAPRAAPKRVLPFARTLAREFLAAGRRQKAQIAKAFLQRGGGPDPG